MTLAARLRLAIGNGAGSEVIFAESGGWRSARSGLWGLRPGANTYPVNGPRGLAAGCGLRDRPRGRRGRRGVGGQQQQSWAGRAQWRWCRRQAGRRCRTAAVLERVVGCAGGGLVGGRLEGRYFWLKAAGTWLDADALFQSVESAVSVGDGRRRRRGSWGDHDAAVPRQATQIRRGQWFMAAGVRWLAGRRGRGGFASGGS
ncbi:hypothetical protein T440DRAFT_166532 [Plenodomus tracheiphilus IPT5]|uniref:Uncharacterized protein n=1 Tax=Plenodomus tracheiphilus IPT5 TaxID=1408161 RepID=A0A6A7AZC9_9PLEO|nr:hypothetical protein T440DRAFT_166532 [Plenodomus tracheiphilus IPT5]